MSYTSGSLTSGQLEIGIALVLHDRFSNASREASAQIRKLHMDARNAVSANLDLMNSIAQTGYNAALNIGQGMVQAIGDGARFADTMVSVKAITGSTDDQFKKLQKTAQSLGLQTMFDSQEIASGMKYLAMAGTQTEDIHEMIKGAAMIANATGVALGGKGGSADMLTNVMRMFKIEASEAATVVGDQLTKATISSNISMSDMAEAIKYAGADMVTLKQSLPSVAAMIGTLGNAGIQGSMAGTAIANMARYLNKSISQSTFKGFKALELLGLSREDLIDAKGDLIDFGLVLQKINENSQSLTSTEKNAVFQDMFGVRGNRAAVAIANALEGYQDLLGKIVNESTGTSGGIVAQRMDSIAGSIDKMKSSLENFRVTFTTMITPVIKPILDAGAVVVDVLRQIIGIPILGHILAIGAAATVLFVGIGAKLVMMRTMYLMMFKGDSQIQPKLWFSILTNGWNGALLKAKQYLGIQTAITALQKGGLGSAINETLMSHPGQWVGNAKMTYNKKGAPLYWQRGPNNKGIVRTTLDGAKQAVSKESLTTFLMGGGTAATTPHVTSLAGAMSGTGSKLLGRVIGVGGRILGFLGGPLGLAITAGSMLLPTLVTRMQTSSRSQDKNTDAVDRLNNTTHKHLMEKLANSKAQLEQKALTEEMKNLAQVIQFWATKIGEQDKEPVFHATINLDGKPIKDVVDKAVKENNEQLSYALNTR